jgi:hypothetical protein
MNELPEETLCFTIILLEYPAGTNACNKLGGGGLQWCNIHWNILKPAKARQSPPKFDLDWFDICVISVSFALQSFIPSIKIISHIFEIDSKQWRSTTRKQF